MNAKRVLLPAAALAVVVAMAWSVFGPAVAQEKKAEPGRPVVKWDYKVFRAEGSDKSPRSVSPEKIEATLKMLGEEGWECVGTASEGCRPEYLYLICKRPKQ